MSVYICLAPMSCNTQLSVVSIHSSSFLPLTRSCQECYTWRTAKTTLKARVSLSVLSNISCGYVDCLSLSPFLPVSCVCWGEIEVQSWKPFPTHVHKHSLFSISSIWTWKVAQISPLFSNFLCSQCTHSTCYFELERQYCTVVSSGETT